MFYVTSPTYTTPLHYDEDWFSKTHFLADLFLQSVLYDVIIKNVNEPPPNRLQKQYLTQNDLRLTELELNEHAMLDI